MSEQEYKDAWRLLRGTLERTSEVGDNSARRGLRLALEAMDAIDPQQKDSTARRNLTDLQNKARPHR